MDEDERDEGQHDAAPTTIPANLRTWFARAAHGPPQRGVLVLAEAKTNDPATKAFDTLRVAGIHPASTQVLHTCSNLNATGHYMRH